ncbi:MAG: choice-of-anchor D domain-containing protein [Bryobacteraceae bacterium]
MLRSLSLSFLLAASFAAAQTTSPVSLRVQISGAVQNIAEGGTISFAADAIGKPVDATLTVSYRGAGSLNITRFEFNGSNDFTISGIPSPDVAFLANESFTVGIRYRPATSVRATALIRFSYTDNPPTPPGNRLPVNGSVGLNLVGVAPEFGFTLITPNTSNVITLQNGDPIVFPATPVNEANTATVVITNRGSGTGTVGSIRSTGAVFSLSSTAIPPAAVDPGRDLRFTIRYAPLVIENSSGSVSVELIDRTTTFSLSGTATGAVYTYEVIQEGGSVAGLDPGGVITLPDSNVNEKSVVFVRVRNTGNADGRVAAISIQGTGFTLTDTPFVPLVLTPGSAASMAVNFSPTTPGRATGRLRIGADSFEIVSNGIGVQLTYAYTAANVTTTVVSGQGVSFPPITAGQTSTLRFIIGNAGTAAGSVNIIGISTTGTTFAVAQVPNLPATIAPGQTLQFTVTFAPTTTGPLTGGLRIDGANFTLNGVANQPPALPDYSFSGSSGVQQPGQQVAVGLSLAAAYALPLTGTLTLAFNSDVFANDPAVQFAAGGRTLAFTIAAGQRDAVFPNGQTTARFQTGTVAGILTLTPSFQSDGGIALTPQTPPVLTLTVPSQAPRLLSVQIASRTASGFQLLITGYATNRQITQIDLQLTPVAGENVTTSRISLNAEASFNAYYQSSTSVPFGSQFTATVPLTIQGDLVNARSLTETLKSVSVTLTNRLGTTPAVSVDVQ